MLVDVATNTEHLELDEGAQHVADHAAGSNGVANAAESLECCCFCCCCAEQGFIPDDSLSKVPSEFPEVCSSPLPGNSVEGYEELMAGAVMPCILKHGLVHTLPISPPQQEHCDLVAIRQDDALDLCSGDSLLPKLSCAGQTLGAAEKALGRLVDPLGSIKDDGEDSIGLILRAAAKAVEMLGTALDCSVELLSYFCCNWCMLKISCADEFSLPPFALDAWMLICWMRSALLCYCHRLHIRSAFWCDGQNQFCSFCCLELVLLEAEAVQLLLHSDSMFVEFHCQELMKGQRLIVLCINLLELGPGLLLLPPDACFAGVGVWRVAIGFCFYVKGFFWVVATMLNRWSTRTGLALSQTISRAKSSKAPVAEVKHPGFQQVQHGNSPGNIGLNHSNGSPRTAAFQYVRRQQPSPSSSGYTILQLSKKTPLRKPSLNDSTGWSFN
ncbi:hypothetical protein Nepgr_022789 [Nepenthes gracilis]|uniref:Uncharacterized protein n=1 Tax=Nepenthes gracilis TaxID=150966 RepID=A0AAD3T1J0_NEPGR|nr:hypothetical protein Nepgr_022789 [Nepenthes gracilis]